MGFFFAHARGSVKRVNGPWKKQSVLKVMIEGLKIRNQAIITQAGVDQNGSFQFLHPVDEQIFLYVFGRRISEIYLAGVAFGTPCDGEEGKPGTDAILEFYDQQNVNVRAEPVIVSIGNKGFRSFLTGCKVDIADAETQLAQWLFRLHCLPAKK